MADHALHQQTGFLLQRAHFQARRLFNRALRPLGIEARHMGILMALTHNDVRCNQKQISEQLQLDKSAVVLIVDDLERLGLARRHRDERDRRAFLVEITDRGREHLKEAEAIAEKVGRRMLAGLSPRDGKQLDRMLTRIAQNCEERVISED